ncbi:MFS transporter [Sphingomonas sp.]|jgi:MFS family permease|uniref:MFS transporter n=1 Tax=Sphingomonas sp. TaxID=28214 RepID=UPI002D803874|nr:MFS transporter [Sphingomonas sp.]HEU0043423.1 MFS transporter [Sphingomonas sp.]
MTAVALHEPAPGARVAEFRRAWRVVLAAALGAGTGAVPIAFYSFGALVGPLSAAFGWSRAEITAAPLFLTIGGLVAGIFAGAAADRYGARRVVLISQVALVLAFAAMALLPRSLPLFYFGYAMIAVLGAGTMTMTWTRAITGWFVAGRGLALGLSLVGTGLIGALLPTYVNRLVEAYGWQGAFIGLAALPLLLGMPLTIAFFREPEEAGARGEAAPAVDEGGFSLRQALATRCFWQMVLSFTVVAVAISAINVHAVPLLTDRGVTPAAAAALAGLIGLAVTGGRLVSGFLLDRMSGPLLAFLMFGLPALACLLLVGAGTNLWLCGLAIAIVGLAAGAEHDIAAYFCARYFGRKHYGKTYGLLYTLYGVGAGLGPFVAGWAVGESGDYRPALYGGAALFATAAALILTLRGPVDVSSDVAPAK